MEVGIDKTYSSDYFTDETNYNQYSVVSLDMLFTPVSTFPTAATAPNMGKGMILHHYTVNFRGHTSVTI